MKRNDIKTILVIGSGPIIIGQAAEFDYAGTQACLALKEEGYNVILINSNPATIMTDKEIADKVLKKHNIVDDDDTVYNINIEKFQGQYMAYGKNHQFLAQEFLPIHFVL